ncbi:hypothetical protein PoB_000092100 [Plakobranchus ocellatus]|uniref:Uncharacterized protein n=1 Tax=Plakobranchus ocellatus TaxID=259542 RepID=A0AAV3XUE4_9GAST|nr:hypothetical protein PoB_000092100 [Plakobranchus ocellatus]
MKDNVVKDYTLKKKEQVVTVGVKASAKLMVKLFRTGLTQLAICSLRCEDGSYLLADWIHAQRSSTCSRASVEDGPVQLQDRLSVKALHVQKTWT